MHFSLMNNGHLHPEGRDPQIGDRLLPPNRERRIFYGWWVVVAVFFIALYISGAVYWGFTAIFEPIARETGWTYS